MAASNRRKPNRDYAARSRRIEAELAAVVEAIRAGHTTSRALEGQLGLSHQTVLPRIGVLIESGTIEGTAAKYSRAQSYRLVADD